MVMVVGSSAFNDSDESLAPRRRRNPWQMFDAGPDLNQTSLLGSVDGGGTRTSDDAEDQRTYGFVRWSEREREREREREGERDRGG